jgi:hypothetical protein
MSEMRVVNDVKELHPVTTKRDANSATALM